MSMPEFPAHDPCLTREQALNRILSSIAVEELALGHIMNAEGEKLQYLLKIKKNECNADYDDLIAATKSVTALMDVLMQTQMLLKGKMESALAALPNPPPCPPPCPPCPPPCCEAKNEKAVFMTKQHRWESLTALPFVKACGEGIRLCPSDNTKILLPACKKTAFELELLLPSPQQNTVTIGVKACGGAEAVPDVLRFPTRQNARCLTASGILTTNECDEAYVSLCLLSRHAICVERVRLTLCVL